MDIELVWTCHTFLPNYDLSCIKTHKPGIQRGFAMQKRPPSRPYLLSPSPVPSRLWDLRVLKSDMQCLCSAPSFRCGSKRSKIDCLMPVRYQKKGVGWFTILSLDSLYQLWPCHLCSTQLGRHIHFLHCSPHSPCPLNRPGFDIIRPCWGHCADLSVWGLGLTCSGCIQWGCLGGCMRWCSNATIPLIWGSSSCYEQHEILNSTMQNLWKLFRPQHFGT